MQQTQEMCVQSPGREDPLEAGMFTPSRILAGESHGQRSLAGYSPWGHRVLDMTQHSTHSLGGGLLLWGCSGAFSLWAQCDLLKFQPLMEPNMDHT